MFEGLGKYLSQAFLIILGCVSYADRVEIDFVLLVQPTTLYTEFQHRLPGLSRRHSALFPPCPTSDLVCVLSRSLAWLLRLRSPEKQQTPSGFADPATSRFVPANPSLSRHTSGPATAVLPQPGHPDSAH